MRSFWRVLFWKNMEKQLFFRVASVQLNYCIKNGITLLLNLEI